jgi:hypothetical protein
MSLYDEARRNTVIAITQMVILRSFFAPVLFGQCLYPGPGRQRIHYVPQSGRAGCGTAWDAHWQRVAARGAAVGRLFCCPLGFPTPLLAKHLHPLGGLHQLLDMVGPFCEQLALQFDGMAMRITGGDARAAVVEHQPAFPLVMPCRLQP